MSVLKCKYDQELGAKYQIGIVSFMQAETFIFC